MNYKNIAGLHGRGAKRLDEAGATVVELGFALPVLLFLCLGGLEISNMAMAYTRVNNIAIKTADNAARVRSSIDEADIKEIFLGAKLMGDQVDFSNHGRIILSTIEPVMNAASPPAVVNQKITWQRCFGAHPGNSSHGLTGDLSVTGFGLASETTKITASKNTAVMYAEVIYDYQPLFASRIFGNLTMRVGQAITVRERTDQTLKNGTRLTVAQQDLCTNAHSATP